MKKALALVLALALTLPLFSCGDGGLAVVSEEETAETATATESDAPKVIPTALITETPDYSLPEGASTDEIRAMAVKAMRDELTVLWTVEKPVTYQKDNAGAGKDFVMNPNSVYAGLPYTDARSGLLHFLQVYDPATGRVDTSSTTINERLGNSCASSVLWGWSSVVTSISWYVTNEVAPGKGCIPVGPYAVDPDLTNYTVPGKGTIQTAQTNGEATMYASYAACLPADALVTAGNGEGSHTMMVIEPAQVVMNGGAVDPDKSFLVIQDQRMGLLSNAAPYVVKEDGQTHHYAGRTRAEISFRDLYRDGYLPYTAAEFIGQKPYTVPAAALAGTPETLDELLAARITSPYKIVTVSAVFTDGAGKEVYSVKKTLLKADQYPGRVYDISLEEAAMRSSFTRKLTAGQSYAATVSVLLASGTEHTVFSGTVAA
ncbi:MAG: hypothetical protein II776_06985 [Clostridia bacterium]|nr:hypothetical protein [Clostridia bacterium]